MDKKQIIAEFNRLIETFSISRTQKDTITKCINDIIEKVYTADTKTDNVKNEKNTIEKIYIKPLTKNSDIVDVIYTINRIMYNLREQNILAKK